MSIATCALIGFPTSAFPALRAFLMDHGAYEDLCQVHSLSNIHCLARQIHFDKIYAQGALGSGLGSLVAYYLFDLAGFSSCSLAGDLLIALGCYIIGTSPEEAAGFDGVLWGYFLICLGAPFAILSALDVAFSVGTWAFPLTALLLATAELSSGIWQLAITYFKSESPMELFNLYLYVPASLLTATILVTPLCDQAPPGNVARLVKQLLNLKQVLPGRSVNDLPLLEHDVEDLDESLWAIGREDATASKIRSRWFTVIFTFFVVNMLILDGYMSSGPEYAWSVNSYPSVVISYLSVYAPITTSVGLIITACAFLRVSHFQIICWTGVLCAICPLLLVGGFWEASSLLVPFNRLLLQVVASNYCARVFGFDSFGFMYGALNLFSGVTTWLLPVFDSFILTYEGPSRNLMVAVALISLAATVVSIRLFASKCSYVDRCLLEREAERSVRGAISL